MYPKSNERGQEEERKGIATVASITCKHTHLQIFKYVGTHTHQIGKTCVLKRKRIRFFEIKDEFFIMQSLILLESSPIYIITA